MDHIYRPHSRSTAIDVADARDVLRAQLYRHFPPVESQYLPVNLVGMQSKNSKSENDYRRPLRAATNKNLGAGAFMKGETLRGLDGRVFRQGTSVGSGRRRVICGRRHYFRAIPRNSSGVVFSTLGGRIEADIANGVEASNLRKMLAPEDSWYFAEWPDAGQADEMFRLFINVDECEDTIGRTDTLEYSNAI
jgi:hypothetical protein